MKKAVYFIPLLIVFLLPLAAKAESSSHVEINNSINSSSSNNGLVNSHSSVTVTTNGETKHFESNGTDINYESDDGSTKVKINNNGSSSVAKTPTPTKISTNSAHTDDILKDAQKATKEAEQLKKKIEEEQKNFLEKIRDYISDFLSSIF